MHLLEPGVHPIHTPYTPPAIKKINLINDNTYCIRIHGNWLNLKRRTTETILRTSTPRMMVILRQGFRRISRCSLGIMKLCLSFFLWLYQFIMRQNDQNTPEAVEHDYLEGETGFFSVCDSIVLIEHVSKFNFSNISSPNSRPRSRWNLCGSLVEHWSAESEGLRFDSSWKFSKGGRVRSQHL